ncbi:MAG: hypothetical protein EHM93_01955 [Bacteroidales bacterium]|nr:MAG: hypothetical protein EHM93_01955 [Bacteroidales bacterium]
MRQLETAFVVTLFICSSLTLKAQEYHYTIDLTGSISNTFRVELKCPKIQKDTIDFKFLTSAENGDIRVVKYADLVTTFNAIDNDGNALNVKRDKEFGSFKIYNARQLSTISYTIESTWENKKWKQLFPPSGVCFKPDRMVYFTTVSLLGYFNGLEKNPVDLKITRPKGLACYTGLNCNETNNGTIELNGLTFKQLSESPFVFTNQDNATIDVKGTKFMISVYSEDGRQYSDLIKSELTPYLNAIGDFFPKMPVKKYNILIYVKDVTKWGEKYRSGKLGMLSFFKMVKQLGKLGFGANGYQKGTSFCIADIGNDYYLMESLNSTLIHEFIHIVNPYQFFADTEYEEAYSKNNWLWEGATSYFEILAQLQSGILSKKEFLYTMRTNIHDSYSMPENVSLIELCEKINEKPYSDHLMQVYWKGSVTNMLLDFEIMRLTDGEKTLKSVLFQLADKYYSQKKSINENDVIPEIVSSVKPELQTFFNRFVIGTDSLEISKGFDVIGLEYYKKFSGSLPTDPIWDNDIEKANFMLPPDSKNPEYVIKKVGENDFVGFQKGDRVKRYDVFKSLTNSEGENLPEGTETQLTIIRDNKPVTLTYKVKYKTANYTYYIREKKEKSPQQEKLFKIWSSK